MTTAPLETTEYIVSFIDILGATEMIKNDQDKYLDLIHESYRKTLSFIEKSNNHNIPIVCKIFSDNIVLARPVNDNIDLAFLRVVQFSAYLQFQLATKDILVRGGITKGKFYHDDVMVWGTALVDSANLEKEKAIYPRIIIDPELIQELIDRNILKNKIWLDDITGNPDSICQDKAPYDELYYVNSLIYILPLETSSDALIAAPGALDYLMNFTNLNLKEHANNPRILEKHQWYKDKLDEKKKELELLRKAGTSL